MNKFTFFRIKITCSSKDTLKKKDNYKLGDDICCIYPRDKRNQLIKKTTQQNKKRKGMIRHFTEEET